MWLQSVLVWIRSKICTDQAPFTRQNSSKQICGWILMWETTADGLFHWRKHYYGLCCFSFCLLQMLTDGLEWCGLLVDYCDVFISCLDSHSDGTHSLQSIHCWASDAMTHFSKWRNKLINILEIFIFGWTIFLITQIFGMMNDGHLWNLILI